ncbi:hypothetical protein LTR99_007381 [Exophiala xenobiotica]|uniref:CFEM domain-containing protein n=1 Tax=Vermiconidia calcicola TaxID=1690605 RepID=A0AAV9Q5K2_9PEZI|nr:hypothetical protein LTR92_002613 [Exophiala xenobiotica]KAK5534490.1 hypothetical protein LTR25_006522 [Vermiconidia calcicola]KAK5544628.1 hypothetical protein LTR23_004392 [Chaetothyriales sp. CCFEE 6169]KAK5207425.1 hypothetical protein LTR41_006994 [Exophiala xenobiotica]KAK5238850.1 hypothetical protein LTR47_000593 [Exophiala xenobiotica]
MKGTSFFVLAGLAAFAQASRLPQCSAICLTDAIATTGCKASNTQCICSSETFMSAVAECVEQSCTGEDKASTLETAEQFCSAAGVHSQLKKREAEPEPAPGPHGRPGFGLARDGRFRGKPTFHNGWSWGWWAKGSTASKPKASTPVEWVPDFHNHGSEWWKEQSAQWWKTNGANWWNANGNHFQGTEWWKGKSAQWWHENGSVWYKGPSSSGGSSRGGNSWWPKPSPPKAQPTPAPTPSKPTPEHPSGPTHTETWTPYKPTAVPVHTVLPDLPWQDW